MSDRRGSAARPASRRAAARRAAARRATRRAAARRAAPGRGRRRAAPRPAPARPPLRAACPRIPRPQPPARLPPLGPPARAPRRCQPGAAERCPGHGSRGGHRGCPGPDQDRRRAARRLAAAADHVPRHRRAGPDRDGRRQRRGRGRHLRPGRAELRLQPALGAAAADPGADRQPGDGGPAGRGHRRRPRQADQRAVRPVLGLVQRRRPVPAQLPHHRHRVHRGLAGPELLRRQLVHLGTGRPRRS